MTPTFSEQDYRRLMLLAFLGEWMINAIVKDPNPVYEDALSRLYEFAQGTPLEDLIVFNENSGNWIASQKFEDEAQAMIDQYDDKTFWEELTSRLTERDLIKTYGENRMGSMRPQDRTRAALPIAKAYTREFENDGIDRLRIPETKGNRDAHR